MYDNLNRLETYGNTAKVHGTVGYGINGNIESKTDAGTFQYNVPDKPYAVGTQPTLLLNRGYTGHEHLPVFGLINMNGRMYDPVVGRFLSPDPYVADATYSQDFNRYSYVRNNPLIYTDPSGEFIFTALLSVIPGVGTAIGAIIDAACWGAAISGASYTASVAMSDGGFNNWNWGDFGKSAGIGALSGVATFGVGEIFGATGTFMNEVGRGLSHGLVQGGASALGGGDFWSGFASGTLGSWAGHGASALGITDTKLGTLAFSTISGGAGSWATGGDFIQGAANGLMVGALNQLQHDVQSRQQEKQYHKTQEKYNELVKSGVDLISAPIDIAKYFTKQEIAWLQKAGLLTRIAGWGTVGIDAFLTYDAYNNGQPWGWHAYDTGIGAVGMMGAPGAAMATSVNSYVGAARYFNSMVNWINTTGQQMMINRIIFKNRGF